MTVRELIAELETCDPDLPVWSYLGDDATEIDRVDERDSQQAGKSVWLS